MTFSPPSLSWSSVQTLPSRQDHQPPQSRSYQTYLPPLTLSSQDDRSYRLIKLQNGLEALLVQDPGADKSTAAMDVKVGHLSDPDNLPGCAHFCEHLLFMGTEQHPKENHYAEYLAAHGGHANAFTATDHTNYYFDVSPIHLHATLSIFSAFFHSPLFSPTSTSRELLAVHSEHAKNRSSDMWRGFQLEKSLSRKGHPYTKFGTGDETTLGTRPKEEGRDARGEVVEWYGREYDAGRMKLCVVGNDSLDDMTSWVVDLFSPVPNKGLTPRVSFPSDPFGPELQGSTVFMKTVQDIRMLDIKWVIPDTDPTWQTKPAQFVSHFLGHEGPGSILSHLKLLGYVNSLSAGPSSGATGFSFFKLSCTLTPSGLDNYQSVVSTIFSYLALLAAAPSQALRDAYAENHQTRRLEFAYLEKSSSASRYASNLATRLSGPWPREEVVSSAHIVREEFDEELFRGAVESLRKAGECRVMVAGWEMPKAAKAKWDRKEDIYGTEFRLEKFGEEFEKSCLEPPVVPELHLPGPNIFIPTNFEVDKIEDVKPTETPTLLMHSPSQQLWHKKDDRFWIPRANVKLVLQSPIFHSTALNAVSTQLLVSLFEDHLAESIYDSSLAGLDCHISPSSRDGIVVSIHGFDEKLPALLERVIHELVGGEGGERFRVDEKRFGVLREQLLRSLRNSELGEPYRLSTVYSQLLRTSNTWSSQEKLAEVSNITLASLEQLLSDALKEVSILTFAHGNLSKEAAISLQENIIYLVKPLPVELPPHTSVAFPTPYSLTWSLPVPNPYIPSSSLHYYLSLGPATSSSPSASSSPSSPTTEDFSRGLTSLLSHLASEPCFSTLRTSEQLGYLVSSSLSPSPNTLGFAIHIQSSKPPEYLEERVERFLERLREVVEGMEEEEWEERKRSLVGKRREVVKNLKEETGRIWGIIREGSLDFERRERDNLLILSLTKPTFLAFYDASILPSSSTRQKISIHFTSSAEFYPTSFSPSLIAIAGRAWGSWFIGRAWDWWFAMRGTPQKAGGREGEREEMVLRGGPGEVRAWKESLGRESETRACRPMEEYM